jgi:hypothetical protein
MLSIFCDTDNWSPTLDQIVKENPELNQLDLHISINCLSHDSSKKHNILLLQESPAVLISRKIVSFVENEQECKSRYDKVYSCIKNIQHYDHVEYCHPSQISWINNPIFLPSKTKLISMISSSNSFLEGHKFRLNILNSVKSFVDVYGRNINPIEKKEYGLVDYFYSIAIENDNTDNYFSEKLIDCFMTCTIPIYWGCRHAYSIFNPKGMIDIRSYTNLNDLSKLNKSFYYDNIDAVVENYFIAQKENRYVNHTLKTILFKLYNEKYNR